MNQIQTSNKFYLLKKSIFINVILVGCLFLFFSPRIKIDDIMMNMVLTGGIDGDSSPFMMWTTYYTGFFLEKIYELTGNIYIFIIAQYVGVFIAFLEITYLILAHIATVNGKKMWYLLPFFFFSGYELYICLTYTKTAGVLLTAGFLYFFEYVYANKRFFYLVISFFNIIVGICLRFRLVQAVGTTYLLIVLLFLVREFIFSKDNKIFLKILPIIACLLLAVVIQNKFIEATSASKYIHDDKWGNFLYDNSLRASFNDYLPSSYEEIKNEMDKIGVQENDYRLLRDYSLYSDRTFFSKEILQEITKASSKGNSKLSISIEHLSLILNSFLKIIIEVLLKYPCFYLLIGYSFLIGRPRKGYIMIYYFPVILALLGFSYLGRLAYHVNYCIIFTSLAFMILYEMNYDNVDFINRKISISFLTISILFFSIFYKDFIGVYWGGNSYVEYAGENAIYSKDIFNKFSNDKAHIYVFPSTTFLPNHAFIPNKGQFDNMVDLTFGEYMPPYASVLRKYNVDNIWEEMANSDKIICVFTNDNISAVEDIECYLKCHYNENAFAQFVCMEGDCYLYTFYNTED